ncbi:MAG: response regulator transcription factor [bacterium]|nr:MAG: response regulator transcription factor [bacterium]
MNKKILVIEDDLDMAGILEGQLSDAGHSVTVAHDGATGLKNAEKHEYDLIVLDLMLPETDGLEICRQVRAMPRYTPILMLTALSSEIDKVVGLEMGADDYMTKPFSLRELMARVRTILRREDAVRAQESAGEQDTVKRGDLVIDIDKRRVTRSGEVVDLTGKEFDLLLHFARKPGRVYSRQQLLDKVWGYGYEGYAYTVNTHINKLRSKLEPDRNEPRYIQTVWGVGYRFADDLD